MLVINRVIKILPKFGKVPKIIAEREYTIILAIGFNRIIFFQDPETKSIVYTIGVAQNPNWRIISHKCLKSPNLECKGIIINEIPNVCIKRRIKNKITNNEDT